MMWNPKILAFRNFVFYVIGCVSEETPIIKNTSLIHFFTNVVIFQWIYLQTLCHCSSEFSRFHQIFQMDPKTLEMCLIVSTCDKDSRI